MATLNFALAGTSALSHNHIFNTPAVYNAAQPLMNVLLRNGFSELQRQEHGLFLKRRHYVSGQVYYFSKYGECTISFLKDGRVHVLNGPLSAWNLHDDLNEEELQVLIAFAGMDAESQAAMRHYMAPRCAPSAVERKYTDVLNQLPIFNLDWKRNFLEAFNKVMV